MYELVLYGWMPHFLLCLWSSLCHIFCPISGLLHHNLPHFPSGLHCLSTFRMPNIMAYCSKHAWTRNNSNSPPTLPSLINAHTLNSNCDHRAQVVFWPNMLIYLFFNTSTKWTKRMLPQQRFIKNLQAQTVHSYNIELNIECSIETLNNP